jgi:uncharacterized protein (TIGR01619 family)
MTENWKSYFCNVNDVLASIALNLALGEDAPMPGKPWLLWVWVYFQSPRPDGLSGREEFPTISAIEDELIKQLGNACGAILAGRITTDGHREFYFYGATESGFKAAVRAAMSRFPDYTHDFDTKHEPDWNQYRKVLYPSDESMQMIKNLDLLGVLKEHGDTLEAVRDVHHWIYFKGRDDRDWYAAEVRSLGYAIEDQTERPNDERPYGLTITRDQSVTRDEIHPAVTELFRLARRVDAEYDGWETQVIVVH